MSSPPNLKGSSGKDVIIAQKPSYIWKGSLWRYQSSNGEHPHLHFCQKTRVVCSDSVAAQFKVLIVFHRGWQLQPSKSKVCTWGVGGCVYSSRPRGGGSSIGPAPNHSPISLVPASQWAALSLVEKPKLGQSRRPAQDLCRLQEGFPPGGTSVFLQRINRICATLNRVYVWQGLKSQI